MQESRERTTGVSFASNLDAKSAYSRAAHRMLLEIRTRLTGVEVKITNAVASGLLARTEQLETARRAVDMNVARAEQRLDALRKSGVENWETHRHAIESTWEDLYRSIRNLVAHLPNEPR